MITIRHSWCPFQCFKYLTAHSPSHQPTMMISRQIRQIWVPSRDGPLYRHIYVSIYIYIQIYIQIDRYIYIYIYIFLFFFHFLGLRTPAIYPTGWPYHCKNPGASPGVLCQSWIQTRIKQKRVLGKEGTQRIRVAEDEEGANLVNVGPQKTS